jgi:DNA-directed RNA polymerase subunit RPC12/RpoP
MTWSQMDWWRAASRTLGREEGRLFLLPMSGLCPGCYMPSLTMREAGANRRGRTTGRWHLRCRGGCGATMFTAGPKEVASILGWGQQVLDTCGGDAPRIKAHMGADQTLARTRMVVIGGLRVPQGGAVLCCAWCGTSGTLVSTRDRRGMPYVACDVCSSRAFLRSPGSRDAFLGSQLALGSARAAFESG